jgi:hypothetical protein
MAKSTRVVFIVSFILLVVLAFVFRTESFPPYSSYSPRPSGTKALWLLLEEEGIGFSRFQTVVPEGPGLMILMDQNDSLPYEEWDEVYDWVAAGNTLFLASQYSNYIFDEHFDFELADDWFESGIHQVSSDHALLNGVGEITQTWGTRLQVHEEMSFAYGDDSGIFLVVAPMGEGKVVILTQPDLFTNRLIGQADNLILFLNILRLYGQEGIWFNEYVHGYAWGETTTDVLIWPLRLVILQLLLGALLLFIYWGKRFGRPVPLFSEVNEISGEYVSSLANIYRQGRARHLILDSISQSFKSELARYLGVRANSTNKELVSFFSERHWIDTKSLSDLLSRSEALMARQGISEAELVALVREFDLWQADNLLRRPERRIIHGN